MKSSGAQWCERLEEEAALTRRGGGVVRGAQWSERLEEELYRQGDTERALGLPVSALMDRSHTPPTPSPWPARRPGIPGPACPERRAAPISAAPLLSARCFIARSAGPRPLARPRLSGPVHRPLAAPPSI